MTKPVVVAVGAVICRDRQLLLIERGRDPEVGRWSVPGGRVEPGESLRAAVRREVHEEVGLDVTVGSLVGMIERSGPSYHYVVADFECQLLGAHDPVAGDDAAAAAWVPLGQLDDWDLVDGLADFLVEHGIV